MFIKTHFMKNTMKKMLLGATLALACGFTNNASAQIFVKIRPTHAVTIRTAAPSPRHVWVDDEWRPGRGSYTYVGGHWAVPPHAGMHWHTGEWREGPRGNQWTAGRWEK